MASCALIIGIEAYPPESGLPALSTAVGDARRMAAWLEEQDWVAHNRIRMLCAPHDPQRDERPATRAAIREALLELQHMGGQAEPGDRLYLFYAGHGLGYFSDQLLLLPQDTQADAYGDSALPWAELEFWLGSTGFQTQLCFLDTCRTADINLADLLVDACLPLDQAISGAVLADVAQYVFSTSGHRHPAIAAETVGIFSQALHAGLAGAGAVSVDHETAERVVRLGALRAYLERELPARSSGRQHCLVRGQASGDMVVARLGPATRAELRVEIQPQDVATLATVEIYRDHPETLLEVRTAPPFHFSLLQDDLYAIVVRAPGYLEEVSYSRGDRSPHVVRLRRPGEGVLSGRARALAELLIQPGEPCLPVRLYNSYGYEIEMPPRKPRGYLLRTPPDRYRAVLVTPERNIEQEIEAQAGQAATLSLPFTPSNEPHPLDRLLTALDEGQILDLRLESDQAALVVLARGIDRPIRSAPLRQGSQQLVAPSKIPGDVVDLLCHSHLGEPGPIWVTFLTAEGEEYQLLLPLLPGRATIVGIDGADGWLPSIEVLLAPIPLLRRNSAAQRRILWAQRFFKAERHSYVPSILEGLDDEPLALVLAGYAALSSKQASQTHSSALRLQAIAPTLGDGPILFAAAAHMQGQSVTDTHARPPMPILLSGLHYLVSRKPYTTPFELALDVFQCAVQSQIWLVVRGGVTSAPIVAQELQQPHQQRIGIGEQEAAPQAADVLIITATDVETDAVLREFHKELGQPFTRRFIGDKTYFYLSNISGAHAFLVQSEMGAGGPSGSLLTTAESIQALRPAAIIMVGIAFGVDRQKQRIGDILVARQLLAYELQRVGAGASSNVPHLARGNRPQTSPRLLDRFRGGAVDWKGARVHFGLVLSGDKLVDQQEFRDQLRKLEPEAIGGEMEGAGLYAVAERRKVDWILVKAVCDYADGNKDQDKARRQRTAARNAIRFVIHVLRQGGFANSTGTMADNSSDDVFDLGLAKE